jgi:hypothetical protein
MIPPRAKMPQNPTGIDPDHGGPSIGWSLEENRNRELRHEYPEQ